MQRFKILIGFTFITLAIIALSALESKSTSETVKPIPSAQAVEKPIDKKLVELHTFHQIKLQAAIKSYFEKAIKSGDIVGAGVSIVQGDSILLVDGYGNKNSKLKDQVDGETVFRLGSLSKGFAGVLAAELKDEGKLSWTDRVVDYIPQFKLGDDNNTKQVTLASILSHTSGTPYHSYTDLIEADISLLDIAEEFRKVSPISSPGLIYSYQNAIFALSSEMMQKATGQDFASSLTNKFFKPLNMRTATMEYEDLNNTENIALPHTKLRYGWRPLRLRDNYYNAIAAGGINASSDDMAKWMRFLLGHNPEVMSKSAISEAFNPYVEIKGHAKYYHRWPGHSRSYYGFGWRIHKYKTDDDVVKTIWHHGGSVNNFRNEIALFPEADLGICVLLNSFSRIAGTVIPDLQKIVQEVYSETPLKYQNIAIAKSVDNNRTLAMQE